MLDPFPLPNSLLSLCLCLLSTRATLAIPSPGPPPLPPPQSSGPIPPYVLQHAPLIHLDKDELYLPSRISTHLSKTSMTFSVNASTVSSPPSSPLTEHNMGFMGNRSDLYLEAGVMDEAFKRGEADWLGSDYGMPDARGRSESEIIIVLVDKSEIIGPGYLDAFYFTFYSYVKVSRGQRVGRKKQGRGRRY